MYVAFIRKQKMQGRIYDNPPTYIPTYLLTSSPYLHVYTYNVAIYISYT